ncbi:MAG: hypothetical protein K8T10_16055 [Candidatus Eremiobacteraeota bacterium]|nr:hypothetical protein [Candidatus Eremiobacteraeota bacterium]
MAFNLPSLAAKQEGFNLTDTDPGLWRNDRTLLWQLMNYLTVSKDTDPEGYEGGIPTIWARFYMFNAALYDNKHPLHSNVLAECVGLRALIELKDVMKEMTGLRIESFGFKRPKEDTRVGKVITNLNWPRDCNDELCIYYASLGEKRSVIGARLTKKIVTEKEGKKEENKVEEFFTPTKLGAWLSDVVPWIDKKTKRFGIPDLHYVKGELFETKELKSEADVRETIRKDLLTIVEQMKKHSTYSDYKLKSRVDDSEAVVIMPADKYDDDRSIIYAYYSYAFMKDSIGHILQNKSMDCNNHIEIMRKKVDKEKNRITWSNLWKLKCEWIKPQSCFFTEKILEIETQPNHLLYDKKYENLVPPIDEKILDFFPVSAIKDIFSWGNMEVEEAPKRTRRVEVKLEIPLTGKNSFVFLKEYSITINEETGEVISGNIERLERTTLAIWPNFRDSEEINFGHVWSKYFVILNNLGSYGKEIIENIRVRTESGKMSDIIIKGQREPTIMEMDSFPEAIICEKDGKALGILFPRTWDEKEPGKEKYIPQIKPDKEVTLALDFGTSSTCWRYTLDGKELQKSGIDSFVLPILRADDRYYESGIFGDFLSSATGIEDNFLSMFRRRHLQPGDSEYKPIKNGQILFSRIENTDILTRFLDLHTLDNLKWEIGAKREYVKIFLRHILLLIMAQLRSRGIGKMERIRFSYPSTMQKDDRGDFQKQFKSAMKWIKQQGLGVDITWDEKSDDNFRSEALSAVTYLRNIMGVKAGGEYPVVCLDIGGGTTDIAIWVGGNLALQTSIRLAGNIIASYAGSDPQFVEYIARIMKWEEDDFANQLRGNKKFSLFNYVMKNKMDRFLDFYDHDVKTAGGVPIGMRRMLHLIYFTFSALHFYTGMLFKYLESRSPGMRWSDPLIVITGNGKKFLDLFQADRKKSVESSLMDMMKRGSREGVAGDELIKEIDRPTNEPKDPKEVVSCGLLLPHIEIDKDAESFFVYPIGEEGYKINGNDVGYLDDLRTILKSGGGAKIENPNTFLKLELFLTSLQAESIGEKLARFNFSDNWKNYNNKRVQARIKAGISDSINLIANGKQPQQPFFTEQVKEVIGVLWNGASMNHSVSVTTAAK